MRHKILGVAFAALFALQSGAVDAASTGASSAPTSKQVVAKKSVKSNPAKPAPKRAVTKKKSKAKATKSAATKSAAVRVAAKKTMIAAPAAAAVDPESAAGDATDALPALGSSAFYVVNQNTGEVLLERNAGAVLPIASITKLMTAIVVLDAGQSLSERLTVTAEDIDHLKGTGSRLSLGTALTREEMLNLALMSSENRAASALARNYPGGERAFIEAMNVKARLLGLWSTRFSDSTGLNPANVSSPRDLARLVSAASSYALIREFSTAPERYVDVRGHSMRFGNTNALVKSPEWAISVSKTGYISEAGRCLVMQTWLHQQPVVMVLMDSAGRYTRTADAKRVRKWLEHMLPQRLASAPYVSGG